MERKSVLKTLQKLNGRGRVPAWAFRTKGDYIGNSDGGARNRDEHTEMLWLWIKVHVIL